MSDTGDGVPAVTRDIVLDVHLPATRPVGRVQIRRIRMGPHVAAGRHTHNGPVLGGIESGSVVFQVEDGPETVLVAGDVFSEPEGVVISRFDALEDGVVFLGYFPVGADEEPEMRAVSP